MNNDRVILLLSGGQDSITLLIDLLAKYKKENIIALSFLYDDKEKQCIKYAKKACEEFNVYHKIFDFTLLSKVSNKSIISARNLFFLSIAELYAKDNNYNKIYIGLSKDDYNCYNDCKPLFIDKVNDTFKYAFENKIEISAPYINKTKFDIWKISDEYGKLDYVKNHSYSCWMNKEKPCGKCLSCKIREDSYEKYKLSKNN